MNQRLSPSAFLCALCLLCALCAACGGGGNGGPTPPNNPPPTNTNPCANISVTGLRAPADERVRAEKRLRVDGGSRYNVVNALALHKSRQISGPTDPRTHGPTDLLDVGEIAIVEDEGDVIAPPNAFDLRGAGVRFTRNGAGGYDTSRIEGLFRGTLGQQLNLTDDDSASAPVTFGFPFYGATVTEAFVNSDGNVTFTESDSASTERNIGRLLTGPPRVAPFLADLDPSSGGRVYVNAAADRYTVTWCNVRGFDSQRTITTQMTLLPDGSIEFVYGTGTAGLADAVVGVSPGRTGEFAPADLTATASGEGDEAVGERFAESGELDTVALLRKFYASHPDNYDQLVIWTDTPLVSDAFAYETTVANEIRGIGVPVFDASRDFGSGGRLRSVAVMDWINKYPDDPRQKVLGENSTLSVLAHEAGHRWLSFMEFRDHTGARSDALLGRQSAHWSFFMDSDASVMEGNDIEALGGGSFRTVGAVSQYSLLDQYAMGLVEAGEVPPFFYVQSPTNTTRTPESSPQIGLTFNGTRRDVLIQDIIAVMGERQPSAGASPRIHRQAFVFVSSAGNTPSAETIAKVDRMRLAWEPFFLEATDGRMTAVTNLR
jgi:hypothetical protein